MRIRHIRVIWRESKTWEMGRYTAACFSFFIDLFLSFLSFFLSCGELHGGKILRTSHLNIFEGKRKEAI